MVEIKIPIHAQSHAVRTDVPGWHVQSLICYSASSDSCCDESLKDASSVHNSQVGSLACLIIFETILYRDTSEHRFN